jgi:hypothetical protein
VGTSDEMLKHRGEHTEVIDLQGQMVVPRALHQLWRVAVDPRLPLRTEFCRDRVDGCRSRRRHAGR